MVELILKASGDSQKRILEYLQNNASDMLAEKINNGVKVEQSGRTLIHKKDLNGFMAYACEEARKQAGKGAKSACISDEVVFGWAIHYFEEDSIIGHLYDENGVKSKEKVSTKKSESTAETKKNVAPSTPKTKLQKAPKGGATGQLSLFDF